MRNMSFFLTRPQFEAKTKTVTRRLGWRFLKAGDQVMGVEKSQGLGKGGKLVKLHPVRITDVRQERLDAIDADDCAAEGFPDMTPFEFVAMFCKSMNCKPSDMVTRIEFSHIRRQK